MRGFFIVFEGVDGSGKSTQIKKLAEYFDNKSRPILLTREPGGTVGADIIRNIFLHKNISLFEQYIMMLGCRADHIDEVILPALQENKIVLSDRYYASTLVYQDGINEANFPLLYKIGQLMLGQVIPDIIFLLDISAQESLKRIKNRSSLHDDIFEKNININLVNKRREAYLKLAEECKDRYAVINAEQSAQAVHKDIISIVEKRFING